LSPGSRNAPNTFFAGRMITKSISPMKRLRQSCLLSLKNIICGMFTQIQLPYFVNTLTVSTRAKARLPTRGTSVRPWPLSRISSSRQFKISRLL
jgi:hypothetical protein